MAPASVRPLAGPWAEPESSLGGCTRGTWEGAKDKPLDAPDQELDPAKTYVATVETNYGAFEITLDAKRAPKTGKEAG